MILLIEGKIMYQGRSDAAVDYFAKIGFQCGIYSNPADYLMEIMSFFGADDKIAMKRFEYFFEKYAELTADHI